MSANGSPASYADVPPNMSGNRSRNSRNSHITRRNMNRRLNQFMGAAPKLMNNGANNKIPNSARTRALKDKQAERLLAFLGQAIQMYKALKAQRDALPEGDARRAPLEQQMRTVRDQAKSYKERREELLKGGKRSATRRRRT